MIAINYPVPDFKIKEEQGKKYIYDSIRRKWIVLTPEEWVRQNFIQYLVKEKEYPAALIGLEKEIVLGEMRKRFDILIYNREHQPWMMIECKEMNVALNEDVLQQLLRYNVSVPVLYLVITNGKECFAWSKEHSELILLNDIPGFGS